MYFCTTDNCAIALSKATFPVAMNCPVCQTPLQLAQSESVLSEQEQTMIDSLPYVIAYPLKRALEEKHAWSKINLLKDTFLNYLKYLGLLSASEFFNSDLKNRRMVDAFQKNLAQPSFGSWNAFIRECISFLKEQNHVFFYPELVAYYEKIETGKKRKIYKGEIEYIDSNGDVQLKKQETTAIGLLINFRNRYLGHGLTLDEQASTQLWEEYFPVFKSILEQMSFSREYPMYKREHGETYLLQGAELKENNTTNILDGSIWLENKKGEAFEILPFYIVPGALALAKEDKEQVLSYESFTGKTIKFFSPEGSEKQTSGFILEKLNLLLRNKQKETTFSPETFTKEVFINRIEEENKLVIDTLIQEKKVIEGIYQNRETIEIKLREWIGARANIFFIAAEAGSGKTNLLVEIQKQYAERQLPSLFMRAARMEKSSLKEQIAYQLNLDTSIDLKEYKSIAGTQADPTFILIDGLNEASNAEVIWNEVLEISTLFEPGSLKFVITNRANSKSDLERYHLSEEQEQFIYNESLERDKEQGLASHVFWLTPMDMSEMEGAWDAYVKKDKGRFNPLFSFNDLATFDRGLYLQINNPLVLRIFLETYQGKNLPKGTKQLHIWKDWFATFTEQEQLFMRLLADAIWERGENELELEELLNNEKLKAFILTDNISGPYNRLLNLGWVSRYHKDLTIYVNFTVDGLLFYLLGVNLSKQSWDLVKIESILDQELIPSEFVLSSFESMLIEQVKHNNFELIIKLIDEGDSFTWPLCIRPVICQLKIIGIEKTLNFIFRKKTINDWEIIYEIISELKKEENYQLLEKFLLEIMPFNDLISHTQYLVYLQTCILLNYHPSIGNWVKKLNLQELEKDCDEMILLLVAEFYSKSSFTAEEAIQYYELVFDKFEYFSNDELFKAYLNLAISYHNMYLNQSSYDNDDESNRYLLNQNFYIEEANKIGNKEFENDYCIQSELLLLKADLMINLSINERYEIYKNAFGILIKYLGKNNLKLADIYLKLVNLFEFEDIPKALFYANKCLEIKKVIYKDNQEKNAELHYEISSLSLRINDFNNALLHLNVLCELKSYISINSIFVFQKMAISYKGLNNISKAFEYYIKTAKLGIELFDAENDIVADAILNSKIIAKQFNKKNELPQWIKEIN